MIMRRGIVTVIALALVGACGGSGRTVVHGTSTPQPTYTESVDQSYGESYGQSEGIVVGRSDSIPPGTTVWVQLDHPVSIERNRVGDRVSGHVAQELRSEFGEVLVPRGVRVEGRVVDLQPAYEGRPAAIGLRLETLDMAGVRQPIAATIVDTDVPGVRRGVRGRDVLIGAAAGALLGGLVEGAEGALVGGGLGAGAGALISLGRGQHRMEQLPAGTGIAIRLDRPLRSLASLRGQRYY
jgi:hypothetical protein